MRILSENELKKLVKRIINEDEDYFISINYENY